MLRAGLDTEARGKILCLCQELNQSHPVLLGQQSTEATYDGPRMWDTKNTYKILVGKLSETSTWETEELGRQH
jgi:hypothetical protein